MTRCLAKVVNDAHTDWDEKLDTILMGYRASIQASTKHSPYYMCFQQHMRLPVDNEICDGDGDSDDDGDDDDKTGEEIDLKIQRLLSSHEKSFAKAKGNIAGAQKIQKERYDRKHHQEILQNGTEVLVENTKDKQQKGGKLNPLYEGVHTVSRQACMS